MCLSAEVSFTSAVILLVVGAATLRLAKNKSQMFLAAIPLFFGIQQFAEGLLWYGLKNENQRLEHLGMYVFLFFALFFWLIWMPLSIYMIEKQPPRKKVLSGFLIAGVVLAFVNLISGLKHPISVEPKDFSLQYLGTVPPQKYLYMAITLIPVFISSFPNLWVFGMIVTTTAFISDYFYDNMFVSLWCFSAAISSLGLYWVFRKQKYTNT